jgi:arginine utilization regulatory protein
MIEDYYDIITKIENFVDGLMIVDDEGNIIYNKNFTNILSDFDEKNSIGRKPWEVWKNLSPETSTCYRALKYGETTRNKRQILQSPGGEKYDSLDTTFPIYEKEKIIGAVSTTIILHNSKDKNFIDLSNMTTSHSKDLYNIQDIIGDSETIKLLKYKIHKVADSEASVLIYGETGVGKEMVAQAIHSNSSRKDEIFISQNCAAIPENLLESIFFGTEKGSYTGALSKPGIFEIADGGTIFLDELNSMDLNMQAKLLKAIEEQKITRIGGSKYKKVDVRILAAVNEPPIKCMENGKMRPDLYYRLSSIQIEVPSLKTRTSDIEELANHFINLNNIEMKKNITGLDKEVLKILENYPWPGNVREFMNVIKASCIFTSSDVIQKSDLPENIRKYKEDNVNYNFEETTLNSALEDFEKNFILSNSKNTSTLTELAEKLGISRQNLNYKINKYNLKLDN